MLAREQAPVWLIDWASKKLKRAIRSSVAAETLAGQNGLDSIEFLQALILETLKGVTPREFREITPDEPSCLVIDSKGFYDACNKTSGSSTTSAEERLQIDYAIARESMKKQNMIWINNRYMCANCLTKLKGESKPLFDLLETNTYHIKKCKVSGRKELAEERAGQTEQDSE